MKDLNREYVTDYDDNTLEDFIFVGNICTSPILDGEKYFILDGHWTNPINMVPLKYIHKMIDYFETNLYIVITI